MGNFAAARQKTPPKFPHLVVGQAHGQALADQLFFGKGYYARDHRFGVIKQKSKG
jgi:hypothetical protein